MATKPEGERYLGEALHVPLSSDGQVAAYVRPVRILNIAGKVCGGPNIGVDVGNEEVLRFDCHAGRGHWHGGGYDRSGILRNSHRDFPEGLASVGAAESAQPSMLQSAMKTISLHLGQQGDLRGKAVRDSLMEE